MADAHAKKLEAFLSQRFGYRIPPGVEFRRMSQRKLNHWIKLADTPRSKIANLSMNDFLVDRVRFNPEVRSIVSNTIRENGLKICAGIVSYEGRREAALATGGNTFSNLKHLEEEGLLTRFLSYQGDPKAPSPLCSLALKEGIKVFFVDDVRLMGQNRRPLLGRNARGKTENILKCLLMLQEEVRKADLDPRKVFVLFLDDDYCLLDDRAHYILIATWVLSFAKSGARDVRRLIDLCRNVGFVKNGGVRIHIPGYLGERILRGEVIKDYRSLLIEGLKLDLELDPSAAESDKFISRTLVERLGNLPADCILTPENLDSSVSSEELGRIHRVFQKYFYAGGRVTKPYTRRNVHEAENVLSNWLGQFTFILQGDQGTSLANWMRLQLGQGYAFDSSVLIQFLMDANFADQRIADVRNTPHAHQPQEQLRVDGMEDLINLDTETLRVYYGDWNVDSFIQRYKRRTRVSWRADGRYIREKIRTSGGILFYPPAARLMLSS